MSQNILKPIFVLFGILGTIAVMAGSDLFQPLIRFIHDEGITPFESLLCILFTVAGFGACYLLLNTLCTYFVPRIDAADKRTSSGARNN